MSALSEAVITARRDLERADAWPRPNVPTEASEHLDMVSTSLEKLLAALSTPPADDVRELVDHLNGLMDSLDDSVSHEQVYEQLRVAWEMAHALRTGVDAPPADDVREALEADRSVPMPKEQYHVWDRLIKFSQAYRAEHGFPPNEAARTRFLFTAFEVRPHGTVTDEQETAMEREVTRILGRLAKRNDWAEDDTAIGGMAAHIVSVAIAAADEVRPRGTVTEAAEADSRFRAALAGYLDLRTVARVMADLEAAREARR